MNAVNEIHARRMRERPSRLPRLDPPRSVVLMIRAAALRHCVPARFIRDGRQRSYSAVAARRELAREFRAKGYSTTVIGRYLGGLHHSSVLYMLRDHPDRKQRGSTLPGAGTPGQHETDMDLSGEWAI